MDTANLYLSTCLRAKSPSSLHLPAVCLESAVPLPLSNLLAVLSTSTPSEFTLCPLPLNTVSPWSISSLAHAANGVCIVRMSCTVCTSTLLSNHLSISSLSRRSHIQSCTPAFSPVPTACHLLPHCQKLAPSSFQELPLYNQGPFRLANPSKILLCVGVTRTILELPATVQFEFVVPSTPMSSAYATL